MILLEKADGVLAEVFSEGRVLGGVSYCSPRAFTLASVLEDGLSFSDPLAWTLPDFDDNELAKLGRLERQYDSKLKDKLTFCGLILDLFDSCKNVDLSANGINSSSKMGVLLLQGLDTG